ncbi:MAG TPA: sigma-70 family RNA polymerase sigma factor [Thermoanaerobaculia bacterium]|nr:sigma-70 family RNA polymerase sigma factor [Thermoanaerobaculia bacterium]
MHPRQVLEANLAVVERAVGAICAQARLYGADAEDFGAAVKLALVDNDYAIVRKWEGRSTFATYVTVVIRRLLVDQQRAAGRYVASAAAKRQGEAAVLLERLIARDRLSPEEAFPILRKAHPELSSEELAAMRASFPQRVPAPRLVPFEPVDEERMPAAHRADERVVERDVAMRAQQASRVVRDTLATMSAEDRVVLRMRFAEDLSIADIARSLGHPQRPLYRRIEALLATLRRTLERHGLGFASIGDLIGTAGERLDFRLQRKSDPALPSIPETGSEVQR